MVGYLEIPVAGRHGSVKLVKTADGCWKKTEIKSTLKRTGFANKK